MYHPMTTSADTTPLGELLASRAREGDRVRFNVGADWQQGRTLFGGLLSSLAVQAMRDVCGSDWPLRALQTSFVGPVAPGAFEVDVTLLRQGKNVRQVQARIVQPGAEGQTVTAGVLLAVFGSPRDSGLPALTMAQPPVDKSIEASLQMPFIPGLTPNFTQHLEFRLAAGGIPFTGADSWESRTHIRLKDVADVDPELLGVMLADAGPTPALAQLTGFAPASSVSWALELRPVPDADAAGYWRMDKDALVTGEGYVNERTALWTPDGRLAGLGYQVVAVYA